MISVKLLRSSSNFAEKFQVKSIQELITTGEIKKDPNQLRVVSSLQRLYDDVINLTPYIKPKTPSNSTWSFFKPTNTSPQKPEKSRQSVKGVYLFGSPGCGKTFLLDFFYDFLPSPTKKRVHFNKFMLEVHNSIHLLNKRTDLSVTERGLDPVSKVAEQIAEKTTILCFDEFQVTDIADAMILKRLFSGFWEAGVAIFATSNRPPDDLYFNGLQRFLFLPFIDELKENCEIIDFDSDIDYRYEEEIGKIETFMHPVDEKNMKQAEKAFEKFSGREKGEKVVIPVMQGREVVCENAANGCALFSFNELCDRPLGAADYIAIAENFHHVIMTGIPSFSLYSRDLMRRFILLIDELYNRKVKLVCIAEKSIDELYEGEAAQYDEIFAFERTVSRLTEMQTEYYLGLEHSPVL